MRVDDGDADARVDAEPDAVDLDRLVELFQQPLGAVHGDGRVGIGEHGGELVTAEAREQVMCTNRAGHARADLSEQLVAAACPSTSLISLNRSRSTISTA